jgi:hypothetical protein
MREIFKPENFADRSVANRSVAISLLATKKMKLESLGLRLTQKPGQPRRKMDNQSVVGHIFKWTVCQLLSGN